MQNNKTNFTPGTFIFLYNHLMKFPINLISLNLKRKFLLIGQKSMLFKPSLRNLNIENLLPSMMDHHLQQVFHIMVIFALVRLRYCYKIKCNNLFRILYVGMRVREGILLTEDLDGIVMAFQ